MEVCAPAALDAMIGPKDLGAVVELDRFIGPLPGIAAGEGAVTGRMPVLGGAEMLEQGQDGVHRLEYLVTSRHPQRPTWAKVVLRVYHQEQVLLAVDRHQRIIHEFASIPDLR